MPRMIKPLALAVAVLVSYSAAFAHTLSVPFFNDSGTNINRSTGLPTTGAAGFIGISNTTGTAIDMFIVYIQTDLDGDPVIQPAKSFTLTPGAHLSWRPVKDDPIEGAGRSVPNTLPGFGGRGSAEIIWLDVQGGANALKGRYSQFGTSGAFAHVLIVVP